MHKQARTFLLMLAITGIGLWGCSVQPVSVVPANTPSIQESTPSRVTHKKQSYKPTARSNTAYPSSAAKQLMVKAEGQLSAGDGYSALRSLERAQRISPRAPEVYLKMAQVRFYLGQTGQARQLAKKALSLVGGDDALKDSVESLLKDL